LALIHRIWIVATFFLIAFPEHDTGLKLHYASITSTGEPETDKSNNPLVSLTGIGPEVHLDVFGTGFLASDDGQILTNHHVAEPWWQNDELKEMLDQGLEPEIAEMTAYFPGITHGIPITTKKTSSAADVAVVKGNVARAGHSTYRPGRWSSLSHRWQPGGVTWLSYRHGCHSGPDGCSYPPGHRSFIEG
jgi:hypothetical protein